MIIVTLKCLLMRKMRHTLADQFAEKCKQSSRAAKRSPHTDTLTPDIGIGRVYLPHLQLINTHSHIEYVCISTYLPLNSGDDNFIVIINNVFIKQFQKLSSVRNCSPG